MKMPPVGAEVAVHFNDHVVNCSSEEPCACVAYGVVRKVTDASLTIDGWTPEVNAMRKPGDMTETYTLLRCAITKIRRLR